MNMLVVHYSPIVDSFTKRIAEKLETVHAARGDAVVVRDLSAPLFNPVLTEREIALADSGKYPDDVLAEQALVKQADRLALVFPLYQLAMPAVMKGYVERVLAYNFAYSYTAAGEGIPLMKGKSAAVYSPMAAPLEEMRKSGNLDAMNHILKNVFGFRGFALDCILYFDMEDREGQLARLSQD